MTFPHLIFFISAAILGVFIVITIRKESYRQLKADKLALRCAFVYLVPSCLINIRNLGSSIQSINRFLAFDFKYKIIIIHEDMPPLSQGRLQAVSEAPLHFRQVVLRPTKTYSNPSNSTDKVQNLLKTQRLAAQHVARFWVHSALLNEPKASVFADIDYVVRLDQNWAFTAPISRDFVQDFVLSGAQYGHFQQIGRDCSQDKNMSLRRLATSYIELNGISPKGGDLWRSIGNPKPACLPFFNTQLELINLRFFRSHSGVQDWIRVLDANGGIYSKAWGDNILRYITVALFAASDKVVKYDTDLASYKRISVSAL